VFALASWNKFIMVESKRILKPELAAKSVAETLLVLLKKSENYSSGSPSARAGAVKQLGQGRSCEVQRKFS
jgi:hypothetical protein